MNTAALIRRLEKLEANRVEQGSNFVVIVAPNGDSCKIKLSELSNACSATLHGDNSRESLILQTAANDNKLIQLLQMCV
jgi:hypothetical protein